jgi:hypothetical protein
MLELIKFAHANIHFRTIVLRNRHAKKTVDTTVEEVFQPQNHRHFLKLKILHFVFVCKSVNYVLTPCQVGHSFREIGLAFVATTNFRYRLRACLHF